MYLYLSVDTCGYLYLYLYLYLAAYSACLWTACVVPSQAKSKLIICMSLEHYQTEISFFTAHSFFFFFTFPAKFFTSVFSVDFSLFIFQALSESSTHYRMLSRAIYGTCMAPSMGPLYQWVLGTGWPSNFCVMSRQRLSNVWPCLSYAWLSRASPGTRTAACDKKLGDAIKQEIQEISKPREASGGY